MDKARKTTDKMLNDLERRVEAVYTSDPSLRRIQKKYSRYMDYVYNQTKKAYDAYVNETDMKIKKDLKKEYIRQAKDLTINNEQYKDIVKEITQILSKVNQKALNLVNAEMSEIYAINYNQISEDCKKVGIKVNG